MSDLYQLTNELGESVAKQSYSAFGEKVDGQLSDNTQFDFNGEWRDPATQLQNLRARFYSPESGRFTQMDTWAGESRTPITLNKYIYGDANPVSNIDPTGNFSMMSVMSSINIRSVLGATGRVGYRHLTQCIKTAAKFYAGIGAGLTHSVANKKAFGKVIKGTGVCGVSAWETAFYAGYKSGAVLTMRMSSRMLHWKKYPSMRNFINSKVWSRKNRAMMGRLYNLHHIVEQSTLSKSYTGRIKFKKESINSLGNVVPVPFMIHKIVSKYYGKKYNGTGRSFRLYLHEKHPQYHKQWRIGLDIWSQAHTGSVDFQPSMAPFM